MTSKVVAACPNMEVGRSSNTRSAASAGSKTAQKAVDFQSTATPRWCLTASTSRVIAANASNSQSVPGARPACNKAMVSAPKATNSPCGMKITLVTENTSTNANAISA